MGEIDWSDSIDGKAYQIRYDADNRILAFSSNPNSIRSFGGEVGLDEIAFHRDPKAMRKAAGGRHGEQADEVAGGEARHGRSRRRAAGP
jgi:phage FluMu gp28-like protein